MTLSSFASQPMAFNSLATYSTDLAACADPLKRGPMLFARCETCLYASSLLNVACCNRFKSASVCCEKTTGVGDGLGDVIEGDRIPCANCSANIPQIRVPRTGLQ